jgi:hypothetical protein
MQQTLPRKFTCTDSLIHTCYLYLPDDLPLFYFREKQTFRRILQQMMMMMTSIPGYGNLPALPTNYGTTTPTNTGSAWSGATTTPSYDVPTTTPSNTGIPSFGQYTGYNSQVNQNLNQAYNPTYAPTSYAANSEYNASTYAPTTNTANNSSLEQLLSQNYAPVYSPTSNTATQNTANYNSLDQALNQYAYAPTTTTNTSNTANQTDNSQKTLNQYLLQQQIDARNQYAIRNNYTFGLPPQQQQPPVVQPPVYPPVTPPVTPPPKEEKKSGGTNWLLYGGLAAAAIFLLPKLFGGGGKKEVPPTTETPKIPPTDTPKIPPTDTPKIPPTDTPKIPPTTIKVGGSSKGDPYLSFEIDGKSAGKDIPFHPSDLAKGGTCKLEYFTDSSSEESVSTTLMRSLVDDKNGKPLVSKTELNFKLAGGAVKIAAVPNHPDQVNLTVGNKTINILKGDYSGKIGDATIEAKGGKVTITTADNTYCISSDVFSESSNTKKAGRFLNFEVENHDEQVGDTGGFLGSYMADLEKNPTKNLQGLTNSQTTQKAKAFVIY